MTSESREIEVLPDRWKAALAPDKLFTAGIETCIAVSIYSPSEPVGFLGHFRNAVSLKPHGILSAMLRASSEVLMPEDTKIWIGGGLLVNERDAAASLDYPTQTVQIANEETLAFRTKVMEAMLIRLQERGQELQAQWLNRSGSMDYCIDLATRSQDITVYPLTLHKSLNI